MLRATDVPVATTNLRSNNTKVRCKDQVIEATSHLTPVTMMLPEGSMLPPRRRIDGRGPSFFADLQPSNHDDVFLQGHLISQAVDLRAQVADLRSQKELIPRARN